MPGRDFIPSTKSTPPQRRRIRLFLPLGWAVVFLVGFFLIVEGLARTDIARKVFPAESLGILPSPMGPNFEVKWYRLQQYVAQNGGVDVILIGSSVVNTGVDPDIMAQTYYDQTGIRLRIFNFGVEGLNIVPNSVYAKILVEKYHPALIIFGTIPRDYVSSDGLDINPLFLSSPWIEYQSGKWNLSGWLINQSAALRHYLPFRNWMRADFLEMQIRNNRRKMRTSANGYEPDHFVATNLDQSPDPGNPDDAAAFEKYANFTIDPARLRYLQDILDLQSKGGTRVIVEDMPLHPSFYDYMGGESVYQEYQQAIKAVVTASDSLFLPSNEAPLIPPAGRSDREHLNRLGAPILSAYLGNQLASLTKNDGMQFVSSGH